MRQSTVVTGGFFVAATFAAVLAAASGAGARQQEPVLHVLEVQGLMTPPVVTAFHDALEASASGSAGLLVLLDSPGTVGTGAPVVTPMLGREVPTAVLVAPGGTAAGGAAWVAVVADVLLLGDGAVLGPALPADIATGTPGSRDPRTSGLREYNQLRRLIDVPDERAAAVAASLAAEPLDATSGRALGLVDGSAGTRDEAIALLASMPGSPFEITTATPLVTHEPRAALRLLQATATPLGGFLALVGVLASLILFSFSRSLAALLLGLAAPLGLYALVVLPARWWAVALLAVGVVAVLWDVGLVWLGVPTAIGVLALTAGSIALFQGPSQLDVPSPLIGVTAGLAVAASAAGRHRQDELRAEQPW